MRYKIFVSNGDNYAVFYHEGERHANMLYRMAVHSKLFSYVSLSETVDEDFLKKEWVDHDHP